jgi:hypothetical protein
MKNSLRKMIAAAAILALGTQTVLADECAPGVASAMDQQRQQYISANADMAQQNFSARPGSFATTTCLDSLMTSSGLDIFFKPPSLDSILGMVKNLACEQASQIFQSLITGSSVNTSTSLQPGEILSGVNLGGNLLGALTGTTTTGTTSTTGTVGGLLLGLIGTNISTTSTTTSSTISTSLDSVFK